MPATLELTITGMAQGGAGVARSAGKVVFVAGALPHERVLVQITQEAAAYMRGHVLEVYEPAPERVVPRLPHADHLLWQHIAYPAQLQFKQTILREQVQKLARLAEPPIAPMLPAAQIWHYRNTARIHLAGNHPDTLQIGYYATGTQRVRDLPADPTLLPAMNAALHGMRIAIEDVLEQAEPLPGSVLLRGSAVGGYVVAALLDLPRPARVHRRFAVRWQGFVPALAGVALAPDEPVTLHEELGGITFTLSPFSFFQTNTAQAEVLLGVIQHMLKPHAGMTILDAYCGVGAFALPLARHVRQVLAIEQDAQAVQDGQENAAINGITNVRFYTGAVEAVLPTLLPALDAAILDPPRRGCDARVLAALLERKPHRIAYVACHPGVLARDLAILLEGGYRLIEVQPVDMFPHTPHIECVALLEWA